MIMRDIKFCIVLCVFVTSPLWGGLTARLLNDWYTQREVTEIVSHSPVTYLDGEEVLLDKIAVTNYKYTYDAENNILYLARKSK